MHFARVLADAQGGGMNRASLAVSIILLTVLLVAAFALSIVNLVALPRAQWRQALWQPDIDNIAQMLFHYSLLPRLAYRCWSAPGWDWWACCSSRCCVTRWRNRPRSASRPARSWGSRSPRCGRFPACWPRSLPRWRGLSGGRAGLWRLVGQTLSPVTLILAGLVVSLYCGALNQLMVIFHHDQLQSMFLWSTGTLTQTDWSVVQRLWPQLLGGAC
jgi:iron complex transport system permease protein